VAFVEDGDDSEGEGLWWRCWDGRGDGGDAGLGRGAEGTATWLWVVGGSEALHLQGRAEGRGREAAAADDWGGRRATRVRWIRAERGWVAAFHRTRQGKR